MTLKLLHRDYILKLLVATASLLITIPTLAGGFAATVSPPRFELHAQPGESLQEIVEISNTDSQPADYVLRTADWSLSESGSVTIYPAELTPGSCRPWTRIERRHIRLPAEGQRRYRIQINVPDNAEPGECRVALLLEGSDDKAVMAGAEEIRFPVQGRIAIIIYVNVGDARPELNLLELGMETVNNRLIPVAVFRNNGKSHGRPSGILQGRDAVGNELEFTVSPSPILPGQSRRIPIWPGKYGIQDMNELVTPLHLSGTIEWEGGRITIDESVSPTHRIGLTGSE